jgi:hypothetical protein
LQRAVALEADNSRYIGSLGLAYARGGKQSEALKILGDMQELSKCRYVDPVLRARILAWTGKKDESLNIRLGNCTTI